MITLFASRRRTVPSVETRPLILTDNSTSLWLVALARWVHIAVSCRVQTQPDIPTVLATHSSYPKIIWANSSSKIADVQGVLIEGARSYRSQVACQRVKNRLYGCSYSSMF